MRAGDIRMLLSQIRHPEFALCTFHERVRVKDRMAAVEWNAAKGILCALSTRARTTKVLLSKISQSFIVGSV